MSKPIFQHFRGETAKNRQTCLTIFGLRFEIPNSRIKDGSGNK